MPTPSNVLKTVSFKLIHDETWIAIEIDDSIPDTRYSWKGLPFRYSLLLAAILQSINSPRHALILEGAPLKMNIDCYYNLKEGLLDVIKDIWETYSAYSF